MIYKLRNIEATKVNMHVQIGDTIIGTIHIKSDKIIEFVGEVEGVEKDQAKSVAEVFLSGKIDKIGAGT